MLASVYPADEKDELQFPEIVSKIAQSMPTSLIDWIRGNKEVDDSLQRLISMGAPDVILESHRSLFGRTVYVEWSFPEFPNRRVKTLLSPGCRIDIRCVGEDDIELLRHAATRVSSALGYEFEIVE
jgi:hypothetical protein